MFTAQNYKKKMCVATHFFSSPNIGSCSIIVGVERKTVSMMNNSDKITILTHWQYLAINAQPRFFLPLL
jgi:hypothetical protein